MFMAISWPPPLISELFSPRLLRVAPLFTAWLFLHGCIDILSHFTATIAIFSGLLLLAAFSKVIVVICVMI